MAESLQIYQTATQRALSTTEIIGSIIDAVFLNSERQPSSDLCACALVNSSWEAEARRRIWEQCGQTSERPDCAGLRELLTATPARQQVLAQHIKILVIGNHQKTVRHLEEGTKHSGYWQGLFLPMVRHLTFPNIEELVVRGPHLNIPGIYRQISLKQFIGPCLRRFQMSDFHGVSTSLSLKELITSLMVRPKRLRELVFDHQCEFEPEIPSVLLESLFRSATSVESLSWEFARLPGTTFELLSRLPALRSLDLCDTKASWAGEMSSVDLDGCFQQLETLRCYADPKTLPRLLPSLQCLTAITLRLEKNASSKSSAMVVKQLAHHTPVTLQKIVIEFLSKADIQAQDILKIVKATPRLLTLAVTGGCTCGSSEHMHKDTPKILGLDDKMIETLAMSVPKLESLSLVSSETKTSEKSLISLGRHCPKLIKCMLSMRMSFQGLLALNKQTPVSWPNLQSLWVWNHDLTNRGDESRSDHKHRDLVKFCKYLGKAMPAREFIGFPSEQVEDVVIDLLL